MSKYNRKQQEPKEDEFVSFWHKAYNAVEPYLSRIGVTLIAAVVVTAVVWGLSGWREHKAQDAAEVFGRAVKVYDAELLVGSETPPKSDEENPTPRFKTAKERADATLAELDKLDREHGSSDVARDAKVFRAGVLYDQGKYDEAAALYEQFLKSGAPSDDQALTALAREGAGLCDEARGKLDEALAKYQALLPASDKDEFYRDRALYAQARIYAKKGDKKKAVELYKLALEKVPQSPLKDEIQAHLANLEGA